MKKLLLPFLLLSSLYANAKIYVGTSAAYINESFDNINQSNSYPSARVKIGYGNRDAYAIEFTLGYLDNESLIYDATKYDLEKYEFNVDLIKAFNFDIFVNPFIKAGFGMGILQTQTYGSLSYGSWNLGSGFLIPINDTFDIEVGYEYKRNSYKRSQDKSISRKSHTNAVYTGLNFRY